VLDSPVVDLGALAAPFSDGAPCGDDLEYDPAFLELEQAALGKPEVQYGNTITAAEAPDWQAVKRLALELAGRSRDLRIAVYLTRALLNLHGVAGLAAGLALVAELLETRWEDVHPQFNPHDSNGPLIRVNVLASLCEPVSILRELRDVALFKVRVHGGVSLRDIDIASGELSGPAGREPPSLAAIEAALREAGQEMLAALEACLQQAYELTIRIEQVLTDKVGAARALDMGGLAAMLRRAGDFVRQRSGGPAVAAVDAAAANLTAPAGAAAVPAAPAEIASFDDITAMLDKMCAYYAAHERSSPVPLLLQRARKLVNKDFTELLKELAPDGLNQLAQVSGVRGDS
jgi:type VI secretion system protein ImpA